MAASSLVGCGLDDGPHRYTRFAMGTVVEYSIVGVSSEVARDIVDDAHAELERVAALLWEGEPSSDIYRANSRCRSEGGEDDCDPVSVSDETARFLSRALSYGAETNGAFDVTVGAFLRYYDFASDHPRVPDTLALRRLSAIRHGRTLAIDSNAVWGLRDGIEIAVGGVAKGYAVDRAVDVLKAAGIEGALVNAGGDLYCLGTNKGLPWRVGIRDPDNAGSVVAVLDVTDAAVATSGDYQKFFEVGGVRYHHLIDPSTGLPARGVRSATVIAGTTERADALATGLFVTGLRGMSVIENANKTEGFLIDSAGTQHESTGLKSFRVSE